MKISFRDFSEQSFDHSLQLLFCVSLAIIYRILNKSLNTAVREFLISLIWFAFAASNGQSHWTTELQIVFRPTQSKEEGARINALMKTLLNISNNTIIHIWTCHWRSSLNINRLLNLIWFYLKCILHSKHYGRMLGVRDEKASSLI